jgi:hypothetical protein
MPRPAYSDGKQRRIWRSQGHRDPFYWARLLAAFEQIAPAGIELDDVFIFYELEPLLFAWFDCSFSAQVLLDCLPDASGNVSRDGRG